MGAVDEAQLESAFTDGHVDRSIAGATLPVRHRASGGTFAVAGGQSGGANIEEFTERRRVTVTKRRRLTATKRRRLTATKPSRLTATKRRRLTATKPSRLTATKPSRLTATKRRRLTVAYGPAHYPY